MAIKVQKINTHKTIEKKTLHTTAKLSPHTMFNFMDTDVKRWNNTLWCGLR